MASSKSYQRGQFPLSCNMCKSSEIKWKCWTCESFMCSNECCEIHVKSKSKYKHEIIALQPDIYNISCSQHKDQKRCLYCQECEEVVCPLCIATVHNTHRMAKISEGYHISMNKIQNMTSEIKRDILKFNSDASKLDSIRSTERLHFHAEKEKILNHEKAIKNAVRKHTKKLLSNLDQRWKILENKLNDEETYAKDITKDLETENKALCKAMESNNASEVFKLASDAYKLRKKTRKQVNTKYQMLPRFIPGQISPSVELIHGSLEETKEQSFQMKAKKQYTTTFPYVHALVCCDDGSLWISDEKNRIIQSVKISHGSIRVIKTINLHTFDMALTPTGDILLSTGDTNLQIIPYTTRKVKESKFSVSPLRATVVHVSDSKILVGAKDQGPDFPGDRSRQVIVMDMEGRKEQVYHYDNKKKPLFTYPHKITTDNHNNIYVIDVLSPDYNGRVVVLEQGGGVRGIYTGHPDVNDTDHLFTPIDIVTTQPDNVIVSNVIVSDYYNHTLHILNNSVQCVQYLNTKHSGIELPMSLFINNRGFLFIGSGSYIGKSDAKIHVVQLVKSS